MDAVSWTSLLASGPSKLTVFLGLALQAHHDQLNMDLLLLGQDFGRRCANHSEHSGRGFGLIQTGKLNLIPRAGQPLAGGYLPSSTTPKRKAGVDDQAPLPQKCELDYAMQLLHAPFGIQECDSSKSSPSNIFGSLLDQLC